MMRSTAAAVFLYHTVNVCCCGSHGVIVVALIQDARVVTATKVLPYVYVCAYYVGVSS